MTSPQPPEPPAPTPVPAVPSSWTPPAVQPGPDPWKRIKRLKGWRGALAVFGIAVGIPIVGDVLSANAYSTPGAPIDVGGRVSVPTILGWELVDEGDDFAQWQRGSHLIIVQARDFTGTTADLLATLESEVREVAVTFAEGEDRVLPIAGLGTQAVHEPFIASLRKQPGDGDPDGPASPVEGILAAASADGLGVTYLAFSPEGRFGLVREDVLVTLQAIETAEP